MTEFNLELGMPTAADALRRLASILSTQRALRTRVIKLIHGYGSTGKGGKIRTETRRHLDECRKKGSIKGYVRGEEFSIFSEATRSLLARYPEVGRDKDLEKYNNGITIVFF